MNPTAALKQRMALSGEIGFCRTKFAPSWKAFWVVVFPLRMAKATEFLLLLPLRRPSSTSKPPCRSSQSTMTASNFSEERISSPERAPRHTSTPIDSFSRVGRKTRMTCGSRLRRSDSSSMELDGSLHLQSHESDKGNWRVDLLPYRPPPSLFSGNFNLETGNY